MFISFNTIILFIFVVLFNSSIAIERVCFDNAIEKIDEHLSSKTPYRLVMNSTDSRIQFPGCHPKKIWAIIRHGTRNPSAKIIKKFKTRLLHLQQTILNNDNGLCDKDRKRLREWTVDLDEKERSFLTLEGVDELLNLAERMQNRFSTIMPDIYDNSTYKFKFTNTQRAKKSFEAFATGLFGRAEIGQIWYPEPLDKDPVLRFYKLCTRWLNEVDRNESAVVEKDLWFNGEQMHKVLQNVSLIAQTNDITKYDIHLMYLACAFETAWYKFTISPWCSFFNAESIRVLEYLEDLKYYWIDGYGYELSHRQACTAINDMVKHIESPSEQNAIFYFTHSGTMLKILAHLGLYKDEFPLTHKNCRENRKWKVSKIDAFATNIAFVLFDCNSIPHLLVLHQERIIRLPACPSDSDLCPLGIFREKFKGSIEKCMFNEMCQSN